MWLDNASSIDLLFYSPYADTVVKFAKNSELTPLTIGLYGSWGAGKSSLLNMISNKLKGADTKEKIACVSLNAWQFEGYEDAKIALMESLLKVLNENKTFAKKVGEKIKQLIKRIDYIKLGKNAVKKGLPYALGILTGNPLPIALNLSADLAGSDNVVEKISRFKDEYVKPPKDDSEIENIRKFREEFEEMLEDVSEIDNLTVIIDDLDRCTPDRIIDTLEAIKLFLSVKKTTFIIAVDQRIIEYAVKTKYKEIDGYEISSDYIEKIIQLPIKIPELSPKDIENYLLLLVCQLHINSEDFAKLIDTIYSKKLLLEEKAIDFNTIEEIIAELKIDNIQHEITVLEQKRDKLLDYNMGGYISDAEFLSRNKVFTQQIAEKKANLEQLKSMKPLSKTELTDQMDRILDYAKEYSCVKPKDITRAMIENTINNIEITPVNEKKAEVMIVFKSGSLHSPESVIPALGQEKTYTTETGYEYVVHSGISM